MFEKIIAKSFTVKAIIECLQSAFIAIRAQSKFNETLLNEITLQRKLIEDIRAINELLIKNNPKLVSVMEQYRVEKEAKKGVN
jgi:hypothetical protein